MSMVVKIFDRQSFHLPEQVVSQMPHGTLAYIYHDPVIAECCDNTYSHYTGQL